MMMIDRLLAERVAQGNPVRVAMAGCGFMGRGLVNQIVNSVPGMTLAAIAVRNPDQAFKALIDAGVGDAIAADGAPALNRAIRQAGFARRWGQDPWKVTSFVDGTKMSVDQ